MNPIAEGIYRRAKVALPLPLSLRLQFVRNLHYYPDFKNPRSFNEHVHARKLRERNPKFALLSDKVRVKQHVAERIGVQAVIPTLWSGTVLPEVPPWPTPFVLKANHASGWNSFVRTWDLGDWPRIKAEAEAWLTRDWHPHRHEWWYNDIDRQLLVEPMIGEEPLDYKFFCFGGRVRTIQVDLDRCTVHTRSFYTPDWNQEPFGLKHPLHPEPVPRPEQLPDMIRIAETLATGFPFVRVDLYAGENGPLFGEMTFAPGAGLSKFFPAEYDFRLGALWPTEPASHAPRKAGAWKPKAAF